MSLEDFEWLSMRDAHNLWNQYQQGFIGPGKDFLIAYQNYLMQHRQQELFCQSINGKKHRKTKPLKFEQMFPNADDWLSLGRKKTTKRKTKNEITMGAIKGMKDGPKWLQKLADEQEKQDGDKGKS